MNKLEQIKHFFRMIGYIFSIIWQALRDKRTWMVVAFIVWTYLIAFFNATYYTQSPVKEWQPMIVPRVKPIKNKRVVTYRASEIVKPTPVPLTEEQIVKKAKYGDELWKIYGLESTWGKNDACRSKGKFAGFGVMSLGVPACYDTFEKAVERASYWYEKIRKENDVDKSLCIWNTGIAQPMCNYSIKYHTL